MDGIDDLEDIRATRLDVSGALTANAGVKFSGESVLGGLGGAFSEYAVGDLNPSAGSTGNSFLGANLGDNSFICAKDGYQAGRVNTGGFSRGKTFDSDGIAVLKLSGGTYDFVVFYLHYTPKVTIEVYDSNGAELYTICKDATFFGNEFGYSSLSSKFYGFNTAAPVLTFPVRKGDGVLIKCTDGACWYWQIYTIKFGAEK